jgi:hypothetical protein
MDEALFLAASPRLQAWMGRTEAARVYQRIERKAIREYLENEVNSVAIEKHGSYWRIGAGVADAFRERVAGVAKRLRSLSTMEEAYTLRSEINSLAATLNALVYGYLLPSSAHKVEKEGYAEKDLRKRAWEAATMRAGDLVSLVWRASTGYTIDVDGTRAQAEKRLRRYQRAWRDALKALEDYFRARGVQTRTPLTETFYAGRTRYTVMGGEREASDQETIRHMVAVNNAAEERIRRAGFGSVLDGLRVEVYFYDSGRSAAATYDPAEDTVGLFNAAIESDDGYEFTHEIGHRYYFRFMPADARYEWDEKINSNQFNVTAPLIEQFAEKYEDFEAALYPYRYETDAIRTQVASEWVNALPDLDAEKHAVFRYLARSLANTSDPVMLLYSMSENAKKYGPRGRAMVEHITNYGATNPQEAFAEAFALFVTKGPRAIGPWTEALLRKIVNKGTASLRRNPDDDTEKEGIL